jgi:hypothetical protein
MTQYMLSVHNDPENFDAETADLSPEQMQEMFKAVGDFNDEIQASGAWVFGCGLSPIETTTTVRYKDGDTMVTDGPFAETKEYLGGFWIIKAEDLDAALALAQKASVACQGSVEVRPLQDEPEA